MDRRKFFKIGSVATVGTGLLYPLNGIEQAFDTPTYSNKTPKNIILMVSDGMSSGTLSMTDIFLNRKLGKSSNWMNLYHENKVSRALMDMASASSIVTDSAAASSSWGGGHRVNNGSLNIGKNGEEHIPIWVKFKNAGKMAGCVTTVAVTHATPAGFCANSKKRNAQEDIAEQYLERGFDVLLGGGDNFFNSDKRKDKQDLYAKFKNKDYQIAKTKTELKNIHSKSPVLGIFADDALPYSIDRISDKELENTIPTLAEMSAKAIEVLNQNKDGFVLQIESGKVDWAAHANDLGGLLYEQIQFDEAIKVVMDFAEKDEETLVIITTDHGNANPGIIYGKYANDNFDSVQKYKQTNEWILNSFSDKSSVKNIIETVEYANGNILSEEDARRILYYYSGLEKQEDGLYNYRKLPFKTFSEIQQKTNSVGWISMDHSADYVELAMFGPGSENLKPFIKNTDLHYFMLEAAQVSVR
ncbi:MAG: alkaline phosphatase [Flavobacteriaceae bacterium]